jgi:hypothetical protein
VQVQRITLKRQPDNGIVEQATAFLAGRFSDDLSGNGGRQRNRLLLAQSALDQLTRTGVRATGFVRDAAQIRVACEMAATTSELAVSPISLGSRHRCISAMVRDRVSNGVMSRASCPVVVVPSPRERYRASQQINAG